MLGSIRKKLNDVISEGKHISETISNNYLKSTTSPIFDGTKTDFGIPSDINLSAGCKILAKNEETWHSLHANDSTNVCAAENIDKNIVIIKERTEKLQVDLHDMNACLLIVPEIVQSLKNCNEMVANVGLLCRSLETKLVEFEDITEEIELQQRQIERKFEMSLYKQGKMAKLEEARLKLARQYAANVNHYENELKKVQQERQAVFQDAFQHDLEVYKQQGSIPKLENVKKSSLVPELSLEEITLDNADDQNNLENFLNDEPSPHN